MRNADRDGARLELILTLVGHLRRRLSHKAEQDFLGDPDEFDLTCFRLAHIGEETKKLSEQLKLRGTA